VTVTVSVAVGWTSSRPVVPDEHTTYVVVSAATETDAVLAAAQMVASDPRCVMPTSTLLLGWHPRPPDDLAEMVPAPPRR
jgi:hypothetical protein